jgi:hypothetical protein
MGRAVCQHLIADTGAEVINVDKPVPLNFGESNEEVRFGISIRVGNSAPEN